MTATIHKEEMVNNLYFKRKKESIQAKIVPIADNPLRKLKLKLLI